LLRAAGAIDRFLSAPVRAAQDGIAPGAVPGTAPALVPTDAGRIAGFDDAMQLLSEAGISVAPYVMLNGDAVNDPAIASLGASLVVKLADVPHRTELGAVALDVAPDDVPKTVEELRAIAANEGVPGTVAVQAMVRGHGEAFAGLQCRTDLGAVVLLGMGGVLVEVTGRVAGCFLPVDDSAAAALVDEVAGADVFEKLRGQRPWEQQPLVDAVRALDSLWRRHGAWLGSVDVNPLIVTDDGVIAVDALLVSAEEAVPAAR
jgi:succinyl-CoA synthetase beta subunit